MWYSTVMSAHLISLLFGISFAYPILYLVSLFLVAYFFEQRIPKLDFHRACLSIVTILILNFFSALIVESFDGALANRIQHGLCGGFLALVVCFLAIRDSKVVINKFQFFVFTALVVTALGVGNEILEFVLQHYLGFVMSTTIEDTWLDLISNSIGIILAASITVPFLKKG
ncbi:MAG: hypothetical protein JWN89_36 [Parcubacteria group bacterium]|nr:hypothetical protein [Parcubacteria group bacterium]